MTDSSRSALREWCVRVCAAPSIFIGLTGLLFWWSGSADAWNARGLIVMKANTAFAALISGISLLLVSSRAPASHLRAPAGVLGAVVLLIGALTSAEHLFGWNLGIDELLARESPNAPATVSPNRMGPPAASSFTLIGTALLMIALERRRPAPVLGLISLAILATPIVGYLLGIDPFFQTAAITGIAWPTVIALSMLAIGLIAADSSAFLTAQFFRRDEGGRMMRRTLPIVLLPVGIALAMTTGVRAGYFSLSIGIGLFVIVMMLSLAISLYYCSKHVSVAEQAQRAGAAALRASDVRFRALVDDAGAMLWEIDADGRFTYLSRGWLEFIGEKSDRLLGQDWLAALGTTDDAAARAKLDEARRTGQGFRIEHRVQRPEGEFAIVQSMVNPRRNDSREITGFAASVADISALLARDEARTLLASIVESSDDAMITKSLDSIITSWNAAAERVLGYRAEEVIGRSILLLIPPDRHAEERVILERIRAGLRIEHYETQRLAKSGRLLDVSLSISPLRDSNGQVVGASKILHDITPRKRAQQREIQLLSERGAATTKFQAIFDQSPIFAGVLGSDGTLQEANRLSLEMCGYRADEVLGRFFYDTPWWRGSEEVRTAIRDGTRQAASGDAFRARLPYWWADGTEHAVDVSVHPIRDEQGKLLFLYATGSDVTEQQAAETALRESESRFRALADNMSQLAWMADESGHIFWYNRRWYDYTGTTLEEVQGWGWKKVHHPEHVDRVVARIQRSWDTGEFWGDEFPLRGKDGSYRWFLSMAVPIRAENGRIVRWVGTNTDITERRVIEAELARAKREAEAANRAKDVFFASLSHELRSPLTPVQLALDAIARRGPLPIQVMEDLALIRRNVDVEIRLIDDLLDLVRVNFGKLQLRQTAVDVNEIIRQLVAECRSVSPEKRIDLETVLDPAVGQILADPVRLRQIVGNVLRNSFKFTPDGGAIKLHTQRSGSLVQIIVSDSGAGFSAADAPRIFTPFEQSHSGQFGGLGLGLAITRSLVEMHGGSIRAESPGPGKGATFTVELPVGNLKAATVESGMPGETAPPQRLLLVEDHADTAHLLKRILEDEGHRVSVATSVAEALRAAASIDFDVIVSDVGLPDGSGYDLMRQVLRERLVRGIAMSGYGMDEDVRRSLEAGFSEHLTKPVDLDALQAALTRLSRLPHPATIRPEAGELTAPPSVPPAS